MTATTPEHRTTPSAAAAPYLALAAAVAAVLVRLRFGLGEHGLYWPDEIYQSLEPAHRLVFGYGLVAWEFVEGARNWALPGFIAGLLVVARAVGLDTPQEYLPFVRGAFALIAGGTTWAVWRLGRALGAHPLAAAAAALAFALAGPLLYFGHRAMSETASALPVALGFAFAFEALERGERWRLWLGASLLGIAVLLRLHNGVFCVGLLAILLSRRRPKMAAEAFAVLCVWALAYGLLDKLTWGGWFHSALKYLQFNLIEGKAAQWGTAPFFWYADVLWRAMPALLVALLFGALCAAPRAPGLLLTTVAFFLLHAWTPHKELRFLLPMMPVWCALAAAGAGWLGARMGERWALGGALVLFVATLPSLLRAPKLTFGELGAYENLKPQASAWGDFADLNRLLLRAHGQPDLCGLKLESAHQAWSGGFTYLHRDVPFYAANGPPRHSGHFNYVITSGGPGPVVAREGRHVLVRIADGCRPDPGYAARLP